MIKNIDKLTAKEYLRQQIKDGNVPTCPIRAGERIRFEPNEFTIKKTTEVGAYGRK